MQPDAGGGRLEWRKAPRPHCRDDPGEHVAGAGARQPRMRARRKAEPSIGRCDQRIWALVDDYRARPPRRFERPLRLRPGNLAEQLAELALVWRDDRVLALQPLGLAEMGDAVGVDTFGAFDVSASVSTCGTSPRPGPTSRQPIRSSLTGAWSIWTIEDGRPSIGREVLTRT